MKLSAAACLLACFCLMGRAQAGKLRKWVKHHSTNGWDGKIDDLLDGTHDGSEKVLKKINNRVSDFMENWHNTKCSNVDEKEEEADEDTAVRILLVRWSWIHAIGRKGFLRNWIRNNKKRACLRSFAQTLRHEWTERCTLSNNWQCPFIHQAYAWVDEHSAASDNKKCRHKLQKKLCRRLKRRSERWSQFPSQVKHAIRVWCDGE